jgi:RHS repeat-associated protein
MKKRYPYFILVLLLITIAEVKAQTPPPIIAQGFCSYTRLSYSGTPPAGQYYFWQTTASGTSTANGAATFNPTSTGTYFLRAAFQGGPTGITWIPEYSYITIYSHLPVANAGSDRISCTGATQAVSIGSSPISGYSYSWSPTTGLSSSTVANPTLVPSANITYTLTVTVGSCSVTDQVYVGTTARPAVPVADDVSRCGPGPYTFTATCATPGATILWMTTNGIGMGTGPTLTTVSLSTNITVLAVSRIGDCPCQGADNATGTIKPVATAPQAGNDVQLWSGTSSNIGGSATSGHTYSWTPTTGLNSSTIPNPVVTLTSGTLQNIPYTVTANYNGCLANDVVNVTVLPLPVITVTPYCGFTRLTYSPVPNGLYLYYWQTTSDGTSTANSQTPWDVTSPGTYYLRGWNGQTWSATVSANVPPINQVAVANAGPDQTVCTGQSGTLGVSSTSGFTYAWSPATGLSASNVSNPTVNPTATTTYTVTVTAPGGCTATDQVTITLCPAVPVANDVARCGEGPVTLTATCATPGATIVWMYNGSGVGTGPTLTTGSLPGNKTFTVGAILNGVPSQGTDDVTAIINPLPVANAGDNIITWSGNSTTLGVSPIAGNTYSWNPATGLNSSTIANPILTLTAAAQTNTSYTLTVTNSYGCTATDNVTIVILPLPILSVTPYCGYTRLSYSPVPTGSYASYWQTDPNGTSMASSQTPRDVTSPGTYYLRAWFNGQWSLAISDIVSIKQIPAVPDAGTSVTLASGENHQLGANPTAGYTYSWSPSTGLSAANIANPVASPDETTTYTLTHTNAEGCSASSSVTVSMEYMNWVTSKVYGINTDGTPKEIASDKIYSDGLGNAIQSQLKSYSTNQVLAQQSVYDFNTALPLSTLHAPINSSTFVYRPKFMTKANGDKYSAGDFDFTTTLNSPQPVANGGAGTLGWYYSSANTLEPQTPATAYPYARSYSIPGPDPKQVTSAGPGDEFRMGNGHEVKSNKYIADITELNHYYSLCSYFGSTPSFYSPNLLSNISTATPSGFVVSGSVSISSSGGYLTATCNQSTGTPGIYISGTVTVTPNTTYTFRVKGYKSSQNAASLYVATAAGVVIASNLPLPFGGAHKEQWASQTFTVPAGITAIKVGVIWSGPAVGDSFLLSGVDLRLGYAPISPGYKYVSTDPNGKKTVSFTDADGQELASATIASSTNSTTSPSFTFENWSYNYYNYAGQLVASVAPNGVNTASTALPQFVTRYKYDHLRRLIETTSTDEGISEFVYSTDGKLRFSQNQEQRDATPKRFSYTNYDYLGRLIESGEYTSSGTNPYVFEPHTITSPSAFSVLLLIDNIGHTGVTRKLVAQESRCTDYTFIEYDEAASDFPDASNSQTHLFGQVSRTENENAITWYTYDEFGQLTKSHQKLLMSLNVIKTVKYTYDYLGNVTQVVYQEGNVGEAFYHHYEYDADQRLIKVETSKDGINKNLEARYYYYLHGPLKRVELGSTLQGIDYVYNIDGALKLINHADPNLDPGLDGISGANAGFMPDVFGETLDYHDNDYSGAGYNDGNLTLTTHADQFGGAVKAARWHSHVDNHVPRAYAFSYDNLYQMDNADWGNVTGTSGNYGFSVSGTQAYKEDIGGYDKNGNIQSLVRKGQTTNTLANYSYAYQSNTNKLTQVSHNSTPLLSYQYNGIGQMKQQTEGSSVMKVNYTAYGLVKELRDGSNQLITSYHYDDRGNRIRKTSYSSGTLAKDVFYLYDATGNVLAIYEQTLPADTVQLMEVPIYGAGRLAVYKPNANTTFYEVSDHLGNVRGVIGKPATSTYAANLEMSTQSQEMNSFDNYSNLDLDLFDHTDSISTYTRSQRLTGGNNNQVGLAKSLKVNAGDVITAEVYAKYWNSTSTPSNLTGYATTLLNAFGLSAASIGEGAAAYKALKNYGEMVAGGDGPGDDSGPKAFLTILLFDKKHNLVDAAWDQLSDGAIQSGTAKKAPHEQLHKQVTATEPGYAYIFVSNENPSIVDVYFDDMLIMNEPSPVVAGADYYPFGLVMENREITDEPYRYGYQGQFSEKDEVTGWNQFELRNYDSRTGRWLSADPYGQFHSPYVGMGNNPHMSSDPNGGWSWVGAGVGFVAGGAIGYLASDGDWGWTFAGAAGGAVAGGFIGEWAHSSVGKDVQAANGWDRLTSVFGEGQIQPGGQTYSRWRPMGEKPIRLAAATPKIVKPVRAEPKTGNFPSRTLPSIVRPQISTRIPTPKRVILANRPVVYQNYQYDQDDGQSVAAEHASLYFKRLKLGYRNVKISFAARRPTLAMGDWVKKVVHRLVSLGVPRKDIIEGIRKTPSVNGDNIVIIDQGDFLNKGKN